MGRFRRAGGALGKRTRRTVAVLAAVGTVAVLATVALGDYELTAGRNTAQAAIQPGAPADRASSPQPTTASSAPVSSQSAASTQATATSAFRQIILPDLMIVAPHGLTAAQIAELRAVPGVRSMITFSGASITVGGVRVSAIGVNPAALRSWVPLGTASDQAFWSDLARGEFVAAADGLTLELIPGASYRLAGSSAQVVKYGGAALMGLTSRNLLVVNQALSARLGLAHQVAGLISAPGDDITMLQEKVSQILGSGGQLDVVRSQQLPVASVPQGTRPSSYLQLFQASAEEYCPGLSWTVLAAIGQIESADGQNLGPSSAGALGPMQFLPSTWQTWGIDGFGQTGPPDIMNPYDAVPSAARMLCADGAAGGGTALENAIFDYNHADWYVSEVLALAAQYAADYS
jgi:Transglycosylase SLT domain